MSDTWSAPRPAAYLTARCVDATTSAASTNGGSTSRKIRSPISARRQRGRRLRHHIECHLFIETGQDVRFGRLESDRHLKSTIQTVGEFEASLPYEPGMRLDDDSPKRAQERCDLGVVFRRHGNRVKEVTGIVKLDGGRSRFPCLCKAGRELARDGAPRRRTIERLAPKVAEDAIKWAFCPGQEERQRWPALAIRPPLLLAEPSDGFPRVDRELLLTPPTPVSEKACLRLTRTGQGNGGGSGRYRFQKSVRT